MPNNVPRKDYSTVAIIVMAGVAAVAVLAYLSLRGAAKLAEHLIRKERK